MPDVRGEAGDQGHILQELAVLERAALHVWQVPCGEPALVLLERSPLQLSRGPTLAIQRPSARVRATAVGVLHDRCFTRSTYGVGIRTAPAEGAAQRVNLSKRRSRQTGVGILRIGVIPRVQPWRVSGTPRLKSLNHQMSS